MDMENVIRKLLPSLDGELCRKLSALAAIETVPKGATQMEVGDVQTHIHLLLSGIMRFYYYDSHQKEHTLCFVCEPGYPAMVDAYTKSVMSASQAVTDVQLLSFPMAETLRLIQSHEGLINLYISMLRKSLLFHVEIAMVLRGCTALQRYMWLLHRFPQVDELANSRHIASFLNITPETLSRMRARKREEPQDFARMYDMYTQKNFDVVLGDVDVDVPFQDMPE